MAEGPAPKSVNWQLFWAIAIGLAIFGVLFRMFATEVTAGVVVIFGAKLAWAYVFYGVFFAIFLSLIIGGLVAYIKSQ